MTQPPDPESQRRHIQRTRNIVMAVLLAGFVVLIYAISIVRVG